MEIIDHDTLYKQLLTSFFQEFLEGFFPEIARELDFTGFGPENFLTQEQFDDPIEGRAHRIDVIARVPPKARPKKHRRHHARSRHSNSEHSSPAASAIPSSSASPSPQANPSTPANSPPPPALPPDPGSYLVVFVEAQQTRRREFLARVFRYFALLHIRHRTTVVPIVLYTDEGRRPLAERWQSYRLQFAGQRVLEFRFFALRLSNLPVREYLRSTNPAQLALAARMDLTGEELVEVKLQLLRQIARCKIDEARMNHAARFVDCYIEETDEEMARREEEELARAANREAGMLFERARLRGVAQGVAEGKLEGKLEGKAEGAREATLENARKMKEHGIALVTISEITGLSIEEVEALLG